MIRHHFEYLAPASVAEATEMIASADGDTDIIGGGTWVVVEMNQGIRRPKRVVDLRRAGLGGIWVGGGQTVLGATASYSALLASNAPDVLKTMARGVTGGVQLRNRASLGGSACYANPGSDVPGLLVGLGARLLLESARGKREVAAADFFLDAFRSDVTSGRTAGRDRGVGRFSRLAGGLCQVQTLRVELADCHRDLRGRCRRSGRAPCTRRCAGDTRARRERSRRRGRCVCQGRGRRRGD